MPIRQVFVVGSDQCQSVRAAGKTLTALGGQVVSVPIPASQWQEQVRREASLADRLDDLGQPTRLLLLLAGRDQERLAGELLSLFVCVKASHLRLLICAPSVRPNQTLSPWVVPHLSLSSVFTTLPATPPDAVLDDLRHSRSLLAHPETTGLSSVKDGQVRTRLITYLHQYAYHFAKDHLDCDGGVERQAIPFDLWGAERYQDLLSETQSLVDALRSFSVLPEEADVLRDLLRLMDEFLALLRTFPGMRSAGQGPSLAVVYEFLRHPSVLGLQVTEGHRRKLRALASEYFGT